MIKKVNVFIGMLILGSASCASTQTQPLRTVSVCEGIISAGGKPDIAVILRGQAVGGHHAVSVFERSCIGSMAEIRFSNAGQTNGSYERLQRALMAEPFGGDDKIIKFVARGRFLLENGNGDVFEMDKLLKLSIGPCIERKGESGCAWGDVPRSAQPGVMIR